MTACICMAIIPLILGFVNPAQADEGIQSLVDQALLRGKDVVLWKGKIADDLGLPRSAPARGFQAKPNESNDGANRAFAVTTGDNAALRKVVFNWMVKKSTFSDSFFCVTDTSGNPMKAFLLTGYYRDGKAIRGSGKGTELPPGSPILKARLQKEIDFWMKGEGRKKFGGAKPYGAKPSGVRH